MEPYTIYLRKEAFDVLAGFRKTDRDLVIRFLETLVDNPFQKGDCELLDEDNRTHVVRSLVNSL